MPTNFTLRDCNITDICCLDGDVIHPQTNTDQVLLSNGTKLSSWMNSHSGGGTIPSIAIDTYFDSGILIGEINYENVNYPFNVPVYDGTNYTDAGLVKLNMNYFDFDSGAWKPKLSFTPKSDLVWTDSTYENGLPIYDVIGSNVNNIFIPTFSLSNTITSGGLQIGLNIGGPNGYDASSTIGKSSLAGLLNNDILNNLVAGRNISIIQNDNEYTIHCIGNSYQAGSGIIFDTQNTPTSIGHSNNINVGGFTFIGVDTSQTPYTYNSVDVRYDGNGHITLAQPGSSINLEANDNAVSLKVNSSLPNDDFSPLGPNSGGHSITTDVFGYFTLNQNSDKEIFLPYPKIDHCYSGTYNELIVDGKRNLPGVIRTLIQYRDPCTGAIDITTADYREKSVALNKVAYKDYGTGAESRYYPVESDCNGVAFVHVPWSITGIDVATASATGTIKLGSGITQTEPAQGVTSTQGRTYAVQLNGSGQAVVNVPWTDTGGSSSTTTLSALTDVSITSVSDGQFLSYNNTNSKWVNSGLPIASSTRFGTIKTGYTDTTERSGLQTGVKLDGNNVAYVDIPCATSSKRGLMTKEQYSKLSHLPDNAEENAINSIRMSGGRSDIEINNKRVIIPSYVLVTEEQKSRLTESGVAEQNFTETILQGYYLIDYQYLLPRA